MALSKEEQQMLDMLLNKQKNEGGYVAPTGDKLVHMLQVLDRSSSMATGRDITISTYNECIDVAKSAEVETTVTLITFSDKVEVDFRAQPVTRASRLHTDTYVPHGMTALFDAIGKAIEVALSLPRINDANTSVLLQIFTDGDENKSQYFTAARIKSMLTEVQATGRWTVTVMGPKGNVDIYKNMGIAAGNIATFTANSVQSRGFAKSATLQANAAYFDGVTRGIASSSTAYSSVLGSNTSVDDAN